MFDINIALTLLRETCEQIIRHCENSDTPEDVQDAFEDYCEVEGMVKILTRSCQMSLNALSESCGKAYSDTWKAWCKANDRICYDAITGARKEA